MKLADIKALLKLRPLDARGALDDLLLGVYNARVRHQEIAPEHRLLLERNASLKNRHRGQRCFIIGNGPSINEQDLTLLRDEQTFVVNMFIHHPLAEAINPKYYFIFDPKFPAGIWGEDFAHKIGRRLPNVELFTTREGLGFCERIGACSALKKHVALPNQQFHFGYKRDIDMSRSMPGANNVAMVAVAAAAYMGFREINLLGVDGNGLLLSTNNHFYGHEDLPPEQVALEKSLIAMALTLRAWRSLSDYLRDRDIQLISRNPRTVLTALRSASYPL